MGYEDRVVPTRKKYEIRTLYVDRVLKPQAWRNCMTYMISSINGKVYVYTGFVGEHARVVDDIQKPYPNRDCAKLVLFWDDINDYSVYYVKSSSHSHSIL